MIHIHTPQVKNKKKLNVIIIGENKGGASPSGGKRSFLSKQKFLADGVAGSSKIWPGDKTFLVWPGSSTMFGKLNKKKVMLL